MTKKYIIHQENEKISYDGKIFSPNYNLKLAENLFVKIIKTFIKKNTEKKYRFYNYSCLNLVFQDLFWQYCSNYIKYSKLIKKIGIFQKTNDKKNIFLFAGYSRVKKYLKNELSFKYKLRSHLKVIYIFGQ